MNYIRALYEQSSYDDLIIGLKQAFGKQVSQVTVNTILPDQMLECSWEGLVNPNELADALTTQVPNVILETQSNTGIDISSRYFNGTQLW